MRNINGIIIHCSATKPEWMDGSTVDAKAAEIKRWHTSPPRNWRDIGYHFLIDRNGFVARGRPVAQTGAHVKGHNTGTIGVCLIGGHGASATDKFTDHFTPPQDKALRKLLDDMQAIYGKVSITGHNEYANKGCPGFKVSEWLGNAADKPKPATGWKAFFDILLSLLNNDGKWPNQGNKK